MVEFGCVQQHSVALQVNGVGPFMEALVELTGITEVLLMFTLTGPGVAADTAPKPRVAKAAAVQVSVPKKKRKGYDHTLRVDLSEPDTEGATKYIIAVENKADLEQLRQMLDGESRSDLFSPPENAERRRMLRRVLSCLDRFS